MSTDVDFPLTPVPVGCIVGLMPLPTTPKKTYIVALPDGSIATRKSRRPCTHAIVVIITEALRARRIAQAERLVAGGTYSQLAIDRARSLVVGTSLGIGWSMSADGAAKAASKDRRNHPDGIVLIIAAQEVK